MLGLTVRGLQLRIQWVLLALLSLALAGCGQSSLAPPPPGYRPTYLIWSTPAEPYAAAAQVRLELREEAFDRNWNVVERRHPVRVLSAQERATFERAVRRVRLVGFPPKPKADSIGPACFVPHHFFRYYDARGRQIGEIAVCFCCLGAEARPQLPFETGHNDGVAVNIRQVKAFVAGLGVPTDIQCEPSER